MVHKAAGMAIGLFIIAAERTFADALALRLDGEPDMDVVAALDWRVPLSRLSVGNRVDVVLLDADLPGGAAYRLCQELSQQAGAPHVVFLGRSAGPACIVAAIRAGAVGWVGKDESLGWLISVIRGVARNETWLPPGQTGDVLRLLMSAPAPTEEGGAQLLAALTDRERQVLMCLAEGTRRRDMARHLHMSPNTVRTHLQNLMGKLGVHTALEAVALTRSYLDDDLSPTTRGG
jgi:DNA-binding NarL/FixJ family response regulator